MTHHRSSRRSKKSPDFAKLVHLSNQLALSPSQIEGDFWQARLVDLVNKLLENQDEETLTGAIDHLYGDNGSPAFHELTRIVESCAETRRAKTADELDMVMIAVPVLAWSHSKIPSGAIPPSHLAALRVQLQAHVLAADAKLSLIDVLFSPDQLPDNYSAIARLAEKLSKTAAQGRDLKIDPKQLAETANFISDSRFVLGAVAAPQGAALFRWQEDDATRETVFEQWSRQGGEAIRPLFPTCALEFLPVQTYNIAIFNTDQASRPWTLRAAVTYLRTMLNRSPADLRAIVAPYYDDALEEYRIGFTLRGSDDVVHGVIWPLLAFEDEQVDIPEQIEAILQEAGVSSILILDQRMPFEFCDGCGAPLYPNPEGESVHPELPEEHTDIVPKHLH